MMNIKIKNFTLVLFLLAIISGIIWGAPFDKKITDENYSSCIDQWSDMIDGCLDLESKICWEEVDKQWIACKLIEQGRTTSTPEEIDIIYQFINPK